MRDTPGVEKGRADLVFFTIQESIRRSPSARMLLFVWAQALAVLILLRTTVTLAPTSPRVLDIACLIAASAFSVAAIVSWWIVARPLELAHRENRRILRSLFVENPDSIAVYDLDGRILRGNKAAAQLMKQSPGSLVGAHVTTHIAPEYIEAGRAAFAAAARGDTVTLDSVFLGTGGERIDVEATLFPHVVGDRIAGVVGVAKDIGGVKRTNAAFREQSQRLYQLYERNPNPMLMLDDETSRYVDVNQAALDLYGFSRERFAEMSPRELRAPAHAAGADAALANSRHIESSVHDTVHQKVDGTPIDVHITAVMSFREQRRVHLITVQDMTELRQTVKQLRQSEANVARAQTLGKFGDWWYDLTTESSHWSDELFRIYGLPKSAGIPPGRRPYRVFTHPDDIGSVEATLARAIRSHVPAGVDHRVIRTDGSLVWARLEVYAEYDAAGGVTRMIGTVQDISDRKSAEAKLERSAHFDRLTDLPNRALLYERLEAAIRAARRTHTSLAVLFIDVDEFKAVNDSLGHSAGDILLTTIADRLRAGTRSVDCVARMGGDEFIAILTDAGDDDAIGEIAQQLGRTAAQPVRILNHDIVATLSIGIVSFPRDGSDAETLIRNADTAMYAAKRGGRATSRFFAPEMKMAAAAR